jgi:hypothetical protein
MQYYFDYSKLIPGSPKRQRTPTTNTSEPPTMDISEELLPTMAIIEELLGVVTWNTATLMQIFQSPLTNMPRCRRKPQSSETHRVLIPSFDLCPSVDLSYSVL